MDVKLVKMMMCVYCVCVYILVSELAECKCQVMTSSFPCNIIRGTAVEMQVCS